MDPSFDMSDFDELLNLTQHDSNSAKPFEDLLSNAFGNGTTDPSLDVPDSSVDFGQYTTGDEQWAGKFDGFDVDLQSPANDMPISHNSLSKPPVPCDYCCARGLECFFVGRDETGCSSCRALFRDCTFVSHKPKPGWLDTLHPVTEDVVMESGQATSTTPLWSNGVVESYGKAKPERTSTRFPRATTLVLKRWLEAHGDNPYPTDAEKEHLKQETGLSHAQISTWLANARRRGKARYQRAPSPMPVPIIPNRKQAEMNPFERWKNSPPDKEAPVDLIERNIASDNYRRDSSGPSTRSASKTGRSKRSSRSSGVSGIQSASASSISSHRESSRSISLNSSARSWSSLNSHLSNNRRRRRNITRTKPVASDAKNIYQCTFCTDAFHIKYDWTRHEKTMHLSLEKWICHPLGPIITTDADGSTTCVYCHAPNPDREHMDTHAHKECSDRDEKYTIDARTFYRKDHLRQHLKLSHNVPFQPWMEDWKIAPSTLRSRCGFCSTADSETTFTTWQERADHLAKHFRDGVGMKHWKGSHGFEPEVAAQVTNAMPPFMIGHEQTTPDPFSVSAGHYGNWTTDVLGTQAQGESSDCGTEAPGLGRWVQAQLAQGVTPTVDDIQRQARLLLYGDDDPWNQTIADNEEWMGFFKRAHGLNPETHTGKETAAVDEVRMKELIEPELGPATANANPYWSDGVTLQTDFNLYRSAGSNRRPFPHASPLSPYEREQLLLGQPTTKVASCWTILTQALGHWVRVSLANGITPTDEAIQRQARLIVYNDDDPWNQSQADNAEWLSLFKKAHGLEISNQDKATRAKGKSARAQATGSDSVGSKAEQRCITGPQPGDESLLSTPFPPTPAQYYGFDEGMFELNLDDDDAAFRRRFEEAGIHKNQCSTTAWEMWGGR